MLYPPNQPFYHHLGISNSASAGVLRKIGFFLLFVAHIALATRKSWIEPQRGRISRPNRYSRDVSEECPSNRPFVCYVFDELEKPYPELSGPKDTQCSPCAVSASQQCTEEWKFSAINGIRSQTMGCRPNLCKLGETTASDCIAPVTIDAINETVYFPFNLCTREMVASGRCDERSLSTIAYAPEVIPHTTKYFLQCDAGFVIPRIVVEANARDPRIQVTCIPSLQLAAGYKQTDQTTLGDNKYDVFDPMAPKYCPKGGRQSDVNDPTGTPPYYSLRRALSGPYATLMSEEETINYLVNLRPKNDSQPSIPNQPETPEDDTGNSTEPTNSEKKLRWKRSDRRSRQKRQGTPLPSVIYPRCIKTDRLPEDQGAIVEADELLDCAKNPFYKQFGIMALTVSKLLPCSEVDQNQKFCVVTRQTAAPVLPPTTVTPEEPEQLGLFLGIGAAALIAVLVVVGVVYVLKSGGRKKAEESPAADPKSESSDNSQAATPSQSEPTAA
ncbi:unnamed protein product, partial [Mesorhabditis spiculigera]